jgi:hypothetical protein
MPEIRTASTTRTGARRTDGRAASLNRALAGARAPQVAAARRVQLRRDGSDAGRRQAAHSALVAARRRTNFLLGTLDGLRRSAASAGSRRLSSQSTG